MKALLIVNPISGPVQNTDLLPTLLTALENQDIQVEVNLTTPERDGEELAAQAAKNGQNLVIVAGGDGTIEAAARGLVNTETALGIIPLGTRNNIAASLNIPNDLNKAVKILAEGENTPIDLGKVKDYYFLEVVGIGLEAALFPCGDEVKDAVKKNSLGVVISIFKGLKTFFESKLHHMVLKLDGKKKRYPHTLQINICNSPRYGVEFSLAPEAKMNDGKLDVVYINFPTKWEHFRHFFSAMRGNTFTHERLRTYQAKKIEVKCVLPVAVHADGKCLGYTPITVEVVPKAIQVRVPTPQLIAEFTPTNSNQNKSTAVH